MFERYTEKARRVMFFSRYEASQFASERIETEHILLGILREEKYLFTRLKLDVTMDSIRDEIEKHTVFEPDKRVAVSIDLPLSDESKRVLAYAAEESERLDHRHIGAEHLLLGLLREAKSPGGMMLIERGATLEDLREKIAQQSSSDIDFGQQNRTAWGHHTTLRPSAKGFRKPWIDESIDIHASPHNAEYVRDRVKACSEFNWHWQRCSWHPRDIVLEKTTGKMSFDLSLAESPAFTLLKQGWKKAYCVVCRWELFESATDEAHGIGYTNGRDWVCSECHDKFLANPNFFSSNYPEMT